MILLLTLFACEEAPAPPSAPAEAPAAAARAPDILVVIEDTVRADATSVGGSVRPTTQNLEKLASTGTTWTDVTSPGSWSWPGHASLFTGLPPWKHGAHTAPAGQGVQPEGREYHVTLPDPKVPMLAEELAAAGYDTQLVSANPWLKRGVGLDRGFAEAKYFASDFDVVATAQAAMAAPRTKPLLLVVNLMGAHAPTDPPDVAWLPADLAAGLPKDLAPFFVAPRRLHGYTADTIPQVPVLRYARGEITLDTEALDLFRRAYDAEVWRVDQALGVMLNTWFSGGRVQSVVAVTSDHGEYLGEHQRFDHGRHVHQEVTAVPLVIRAPRKLPPAVKVDVPVSNVGVFGMILDLAGLSRGDRPRLPGPKDSGAPILVDARPDGAWAEAVGGAYTQGHRLYREGPLALVLDDDGTTSLFDVVADPGMLHDLSAALPDDRARLMTAAATAFPARTYTGPVTGNAAAVEALEALGYVAP